MCSFFQQIIFLIYNLQNYLQFIEVYQQLRRKWITPFLTTTIFELTVFHQWLHLSITYHLNFQMYLIIPEYLRFLVEYLYSLFIRFLNLQSL